VKSLSPRLPALFLAILAFAIVSLNDAASGFASCGDYLLHEKAGSIAQTGLSDAARSDVNQFARLRFPWQQESPCDSPGCRQSRSPRQDLLAQPMPTRAESQSFVIHGGSVADSFLCCRQSQPYHRLLLVADVYSGLLRPPQLV
jgi:hypothetical protein